MHSGLKGRSEQKEPSETAREIKQHFAKLSTAHLQLYNI